MAALFTSVSFLDEGEYFRKKLAIDIIEPDHKDWAKAIFMPYYVSRQEEKMLRTKRPFLLGVM